jgi:hypothetical protein
MRRLRARDWVRLGGALLAILFVLGVEAVSGDVSRLFVDHPLLAGVVSGILLSIVAVFGIDAVRSDLHERRWGPLARLALLSLAAQTTLLIDVVLWLATGQQPSNEAEPDAGTQTRLTEIRHGAGLEPPPATSDLGAVRYEDYRAMLRRAADDPAWRAFANRQLDHWKWRNRDGISRWAAAMLTTGESSDVLNRLALLNEWLSDVQHTLRSRHHVDGDDTVAQWMRWHAEAVSVREDLVRAARGALPEEWVRFRLALPEDDRDSLARRTAAARTGEAGRHLLTRPLRNRGESVALS